MQKSDKINIALADDHTMFRRGLISILKPYKDIQVLFDVPNGLELLNQLATAGSLPDVCVIDINMPVMHGYETARKIKAAYPKMGILALSMYNDENNILQMLRCGAQGYVLKDSEPSELVAAIETVHENGFYHSELITKDILQQLKNAEKNVTISASELQFLKLICNEMTYKEIAHEMDVSERTVDGYRDKLFEKLKVKSRIGLAVYSLMNGIVEKY